MKLSLKNKILIGVTIQSILISLVLGYVTYTYLGELYFNSFLEGKKQLIMSISSMIDGDIHNNITIENYKNNEYYKQYLKVFKSTHDKDNTIRYFYSINYNKNNLTYNYIIDGDVSLYDSIWFDSDILSFEIIKKDNNFRILWNNIEYQKEPVIILATAHPAKFNENVRSEIVPEPELPKFIANIHNLTEKFDVIDNNFLQITNYIASKCQ